MSFGSGKIWMNGTFVDWNDAKIHVGSHVVHYGSGVFEGARCYDTPAGSACFRLDTHIRRLYDSAKIYRMAYDMPQDRFAQAILDTIRENAYKACYIRPLLYRGYETLGVNPFSCPVEAVIMVWEWGAYLGADSIENGVDVQVSSWGRGAPNRFPSLAKSTANYANSQLIKMESVVNGYAEGIALDPDGFLSEGSGQNLFLVRDGQVTTPPVSTSALPGITRDVVMALATDLGIEVRKKPNRARLSILPMRSSFPARPLRSHRFGRWTRSPSVPASEVRLPPPSRSGSLTSSTGASPIRTAGSPMCTPKPN